MSNIRNSVEQSGDRSIERRTFSTKIKRSSASSDSFIIEGEASIFGVEYDMGWYDELIEVGAATDAIGRSDVRCLFNHDNNLVLGRQSAGTLRVSTSDTALLYSCDAPDTSYARDLAVSMERGDVSESSFAFTIKKQRWEEHKDKNGVWRDKRIIMEIEVIYDVSPVTYPANPNTSAAKRSHSRWKSQYDNKNEAFDWLHESIIALAD